LVTDWRNVLTTADADPKQDLRQRALARRKALGGDARRRLTDRLTEEGLRLAQLWGPSVVSAFHPIREEPDTLALLGALSDVGFVTALPLVASRGAPLTFRVWRPGDPTAPGGMGIPEPTGTAREIEPDLLFVPLACFDRSGHRIGYGAGYYDRTLARLRALKPIHAVGVASGVCEVAAVPYEPHDQRLDAIVTEQETLFFTER
jgi:5-formyltetrahydrofolate cyclo-ligase